ncbi:hypothetical protein [Cupriavidus sp. TMH.W2]|uniref:hypothetical protein n=1 Tax=Cupriavidus sp. TMH.W2 TaxID=3434465 RepID=UPI003D78B084
MEEKELLPLRLAAVTQAISVHNDGADDKTDLHLYLSDAHGAYKVVMLAKQLRRGDGVTVDLSAQQIKATEAGILYRGRDGVGRYVYATPVPAGQHFKALSCGWIAHVDDATVEEWYFVSGATMRVAAVSPS